MAASRAVVYCRISRDMAEQALGVARQEKLCRDLAKRLGLSVAEVIVDNDLSAYSRKPRPGFERLVDLLQSRSVDAVVAYHADRLYRRAADLERLVEIIESSKAQVHTVAAGDVDLTTASGRMIARMLGAAAQHESERIGERMKAKHDELAAAGKHPGGPTPYGYGPGYVLDETEATAVRWMAERILAGASLLQVATEADARGIATRHGRGWHHSTVRAVLVNPAVAGLRVHRRQVAGPGSWEPVLDHDHWVAVRAAIGSLSRKRTRPSKPYLLTGLVRNINGDPMMGWSQPVDGGRRRAYATRIVKDKPRPNPGVFVPADQLDDYVAEAVLQVCDRTTLIVPGVATPEGDSVAELEARMVELAAMHANDEISMAEWIAVRGPLQRRLEEALSRVEQPSRIRSLVAKPGAARQAWERDELSFEDKRGIVRALVDHVVVLSTTRNRWATLDERLDPERGGGIFWRA